MATVVLRVDSACRRTICRSASLLVDCCSLGRCTNTCRSRVLARGGNGSVLAAGGSFATSPGNSSSPFLGITGRRGADPPPSSRSPFDGSAVFSSALQRRSRYKKQPRDNDSDEDSDVEEEFEVDADSPPNYKLLKIYVKSLRADALLSSGLNVARNKIDELFYNSKLQVNGKQLLKKGQKLKDGDYVDVVTDARRDLLKVKRVKVMKVLKERTKTDKMSVIICAWRDGFEVENKEQEPVS